MTKRLQIVLVSRIDAAHRVQKENTKAGRSCRYCDFYISKRLPSYKSQIQFQSPKPGISVDPVYDFSDLAADVRRPFFINPARFLG